jgi:tetrahydromethanopterin S-methyltransferase subunit G
MEAARTTWPDERLDDLNQRVDNGFARVDADLRELRGETARRFDHLEARIDALQQLMIQLAGGMMTGILATLVTVLLTRAG